MTLTKIKPNFPKPHDATKLQHLRQNLKHQVAQYS